MSAPLTHEQIISNNRARAKALLRTTKRPQIQNDYGSWTTQNGPVCAVGLIASMLFFEGSIGPYAGPSHIVAEFLDFNLHHIIGLNDAQVPFAEIADHLPD